MNSTSHSNIPLVKATEIGLEMLAAAMNNRMPEREDHCPKCYCSQFTAIEFNNGEDPHTGYVDAGEKLLCNRCGWAGDEDETITEVR